MYPISSTVKMNGYTATNAEIRVDNVESSGSVYSWTETDDTVVVSGEVNLGSTTNAWVVVKYDDKNGGTAEVSSGTVTLQPLASS